MMGFLDRTKKISCLTPGLVVVGFLILGCNRPAVPQLLPRASDERPWMEYGYAGDSPEEILEKITKAKYVEDIRAGMAALQVIGLHYEGDNRFYRALEVTKQLYNLSQNEFAIREIETRNPPDASYATSWECELWEKHHWTLGDVVTDDVYRNLASLGLRCNDPKYVNDYDPALSAKYRAFLESIQPPEAKAELLMRWEHDKSKFN